MVLIRNSKTCLVEIIRKTIIVLATMWEDIPSDMCCQNQISLSIHIVWSESSLPRWRNLHPWLSKKQRMQCLHCITKTRLYNFDPLQPQFYLEKLEFTGVYIIFLISAQNIDCGYLLEPPRQGGSNEYPQSVFWAEIWKIEEFFIWKFSVFGGEIFYIFE